eukprot:365849-Chlamydomonas_euryale.AAC.11
MGYTPSVITEQIEANSATGDAPARSTQTDRQTDIFKGFGAAILQCSTLWGHGVHLAFDHRLQPPTDLPGPAHPSPQKVRVTGSGPIQALQSIN